jgi:hypothetical protein
MPDEGGIERPLMGLAKRLEYEAQWGRREVMRASICGFKKRAAIKERGVPRHRYKWTVV